DATRSPASVLRRPGSCNRLARKAESSVSKRQQKEPRCPPPRSQKLSRLLDHGPPRRPAHALKKTTVRSHASASRWTRRRRICRRLAGGSGGGGGACEKKGAKA